MARPTKLTEETHKKIIEAIKVGATYEHACAYAGIWYTTFNDWMKLGSEATSGIYYEFYKSIREAEGQAVIKWSALIDKAANDGQWQAAAWKLERRYPHIYGRTVQDINVRGKVGVAAITADELAQSNRELDDWERDGDEAIPDAKDPGMG